MSQPAPPYAPPAPFAPPAALLPRAPFSVMAIIGFVFAFFAAPIGVVLSHVSLVQIRKHGLRGKGLAIAGIVMNWAAIVLVPLGFWFACMVFITLFGAQFEDLVDPFTFYWLMFSTIGRELVSP